MSSIENDDYIDQDAPPLYQDHEPLQPRPIKLEPPPEETPPFEATQTRPANCPSLGALGLGEPISNPSSRSGSESEAKSSQPIDRGGDMPEAGASAPAEGGVHDGLAKASSPDNLRETAVLAMRHGSAKTPPLDSKDLAERPVHRVDSAQDSSESVPQLPPEKRPHRSGRASPHLKLETASTVASVVAALGDDSITKSPTLSKHIIQIEDKVTSNYAIQLMRIDAKETKPTPPKLNHYKYMKQKVKSNDTNNKNDIFKDCQAEWDKGEDTKEKLTTPLSVPPEHYKKYRVKERKIIW